MNGHKKPDNTNGRAIRGGYYRYDGYYFPVASRDGSGPTYTSNYISSRPVLYIK